MKDQQKRELNQLCKQALLTGDDDSRRPIKKRVLQINIRTRRARGIYRQELLARAAAAVIERIYIPLENFHTHTYTIKQSLVVAALRANPRGSRARTRVIYDHQLRLHLSGQYCVRCTPVTRRKGGTRDELANFYLSLSTFYCLRASSPQHHDRNKM